jgi:hypothetical protein
MIRFASPLFRASEHSRTATRLQDDLTGRLPQRSLTVNELLLATRVKLS